MPEEERPEFCTDEMLAYLDRLRESGVTNMFGAAPYLESSFKQLRKKKGDGFYNERARAVLLYWMHTFSARHKRETSTNARN